MKIKSKRGAILAFVVIILAVFAILGAVVLYISNNDTNQVMRQQHKTQSYYVARAGADAVASHLIENKNDFEEYADKTLDDYATGQINGQDFKVRVTGTIREFVIESVAMRNGEEDSKIYLLMKEFNLLDYAIFADEILTTGNNLNIAGNIGTNNKSVTFGNVNVTGSVTLGPDATSTDLSNAASKSTSEPQQLTEKIEFLGVDPDEFDEDPNLTPSMTKDPDILDDTQEYHLDSDEVLSIKMNNGIHVGGGSSEPDDFLVSGGGELHVFIPSNASNPVIKTQGSATIGTEDGSKLFIYYLGDKTINYQGKVGTHVFIYAPNATMTFNGGGSGDMYGSFIVNQFTGVPSTTVLKMDPGMTMADLKLSPGVVGYLRSAWRDTLVVD